MRFVAKWVHNWAIRRARKRYEAEAAQQATRPPLTDEQFRRNVEENSSHMRAELKARLPDQLAAQPPQHAGDLFSHLEWLSRYALIEAMIDWREGKDPRPHLDDIKASFDMALAVRPDIVVGDWNPTFLPIICGLRGWDIPFDTAPPKQADQKFAVLWMERWLNAGLSDPTSWPLKAKAPPTKIQFVDKCLDDYWALLTDQIDPAEGIRRCIQNYDRRATHPTFKAISGYLGGGQYNALFVDYTLAAILKQRGLVSNSVHDWIWD